jgi:hypothetical protein
MASAAALHFGGYEFARSAALALFTSSSTGFTHHAAYPFAIGLVTPVSLCLLYWYGIVLKQKGPRAALRETKLFSLFFLAFTSVTLGFLKTSTVVSKAIVAVLFIFQNSYAHLLYTQQFSFLGSVMTPSEGTKWFSTIAGVSSLVCTGTATLVQSLAHDVGLLGLLGGTILTLCGSLALADRAYAISEKVNEASERGSEEGRR